MVKALVRRAIFGIFVVMLLFVVPLIFLIADQYFGLGLF